MSLLSSAKLPAAPLVPQLLSLPSLQLLYSLGIDSEMVLFEEGKLLSEAFLDTNQLGKRGFFVRCHFSSPFFCALGRRFDHFEARFCVSE